MYTLKAYKNQCNIKVCFPIKINVAFLGKFCAIVWFLPIDAHIGEGFDNCSGNCRRIFSIIGTRHYAQPPFYFNAVKIVYLAPVCSSAYISNWQIERANWKFIFRSFQMRKNSQQKCYFFRRPFKFILNLLTGRDHRETLFPIKIL